VHMLHRMGRTVLCNSIDFASGLFLPTLYCITILALFLSAYFRDFAYFAGTMSIGFFLASIMAVGCCRHRQQMFMTRKRRLLRELALFDFQNTPASEATSLLKAAFSCFDLDESGDLSRRELIDAVHAIHRSIPRQVVREEMNRCPHIKSNKISKSEFVDTIDEWNEHFKQYKDGSSTHASSTRTNETSEHKAHQAGRRFKGIDSIVRGLRRSSGMSSGTGHSLSSSSSHPAAAERRKDSDSFTHLRFRRPSSLVTPAKEAPSSPTLQARFRSLMHPKSKRSVVPAARAIIFAQERSNHAAHRRITQAILDADINAPISEPPATCTILRSPPRSLERTESERSVHWSDRRDSSAIEVHSGRAALPVTQNCAICAARQAYD